MNEFMTMKTTMQVPPLLALRALALAATGCSTFHGEWKQAASTPPSAEDITGRWEGSWRSNVNGHQGRLRCLVAKIDDRDYRARYNAVYWKIFRFGYSVNMQVEQSSSRT